MLWRIRPECECTGRRLTRKELPGKLAEEKAQRKSIEREGRHEGQLVFSIEGDG